MSSATYKQIILSQLQALLKPLGFRKKDQCFSIEAGDTILFIQLQSSRKSTKDVLIATINLGIFSLLVAANEGNTRAPNILDAHWRERIGRFMPGGLDKWWTIHNQSEADLCGAEITSILVNRALPHMRSLASEDGLKSLWESGKSPGVTEYQRKQFLQALTRETNSDR